MPTKKTKTNPRVRKRTFPQREEQLALIAGMALEGMSQYDIGAKMGLSQSQICQDLKEIYSRWRTTDKIELQVQKHQELARVEHLERTAWAAWRRSCLPEESQLQEKTTSENDEGRGGKRRNNGPKA